LDALVFGQIDRLQRLKDAATIDGLDVAHSCQQLYVPEQRCKQYTVPCDCNCLPGRRLAIPG
jgi:hypothetical protein